MKEVRRNAMKKFNKTNSFRLPKSRNFQKGSTQNMKRIQPVMNHVECYNKKISFNEYCMMLYSITFLLMFFLSMWYFQ